MKQCDNCGELVTDRYYRVNCDNEGTLRGCRSCNPNSMFDSIGNVGLPSH